ncbi:cyanophycinase [Mucilaginibacter lappiensis]|uniref:Cyanophycinase n=1 Tax=Mucilaginibacter lappiensis TaxID=354630 RepID=A0ABR6PK79_9SPHI|nr:cyanophycinase [Mucilaginibacter lappiensis]MBB6110179.1 cyanophycinase [Mucilaginibacter lappiensis]
MRHLIITVILLGGYLISWACPFADTIKAGKHIPGRPASIGIIGDTANVNTPVKAGLVMIGGGRDVDEAFKWMIDRSGGGDVVIIRASGKNGYNPYIYGLGKVNSVETLKIDSRELANNDTVAYIIRNAEMLFIAGGDQSNYMNYWRGTKTMDAINYLLNVKHVPVGGTSAGCAIMGGIYYSGENASVTADQALANPYNPLVKLYHDDLLHAPFLQSVITDQHYITRDRQGRHVAFLSRIIKDWNLFANGIAADEHTAVCVDENGHATVIGTSKAYFLITNSQKPPEVCDPGKPLTWNNNQQAIRVYEVQGTATGNGSFDVANFNEVQASGGKWLWWWVEAGKLKRQEVK